MVNKEGFYCMLFDIIQESVDFKIKFIRTYQVGKDRVPVLMRDGQPKSNECFPSIYVGNAYAAFCEGMEMQMIVEKIVDKLCNSVRYVDRALADSIAGRNFWDIKDKLFIAEVDISVRSDLYHVWWMGDLYFTYLIDISRDRDFSVFVPLTKDIVKFAGVSYAEIFSIACYNMEMTAKVRITVVGMPDRQDDRYLLLYQALPLLDALQDDTTYIALLEFEPAFLSLSLLIMSGLLKQIGQHVGRDYCIFQMMEGFCSIAVISQKVLQESGDLLSEKFKSVYQMYNREELQPTQHIFYYSCQDEVLYTK